MKRAILIFTLLSVFVAFAGIAGADAPDWMRAGVDAKQEAGKAMKKLFDFFIYLAFGCGGIAVAVGLVLYNGWIWGEDRRKGVTTAMGGILTIVISGVAMALISHFSRI